MEVGDEESLGNSMLLSVKKRPRVERCKEMHEQVERKSRLNTIVHYPGSFQNRLTIIGLGLDK